MKKFISIVLVACCLSFAGCKKDAQVNDFMKEYASVIAAVSAKLDEGNFDAAREVFDTRKENLRWKWEKIKYAKSFQISAETKKRMNAVPEERIAELVKSANAAIKKNPSEEEKIKDLVNDIANTVRR